MSVEENKAVVRRFLASLEAGDPAFDLLDPELAWWVQGQGTLELDGFRALIARARAMKAPTRMTIRHVTAEDDRVAVECDGRSRLHDGGTFENSYHFLFTVRNGRIVETREHFDTGHARDQIAGAAGGRAAVERNRDVALRFLKSMETETDFGLAHDDMRFWIPGRGHIDVAQFKALMVRVKAILKTPVYVNIRTVTAEGDRVAVEFDGHAELPDGRVYDNSYHFLYILRDGRIAEQREHANSAYAQAVLGPLFNEDAAA